MALDSLGQSGPAGEGGAAGASLWRQMIQEINDDWSALSKWRERAVEWFAFEAGDQWSREELKALEEAERLPITINRCGPAVRTIVGQQIANRSEASFDPVGPGDNGVAEVTRAGAEHMRSRARTDHHNTQAFRDAVICGLGWSEDWIDYDHNPAGEYRSTHIDPFEMGFDYSTRMANLEDSKRRWRARVISLADAREMFPGRADSELDATWFLGHQYRLTYEDYAYTQYESHGVLDPHGKEIVILQVQWRQRERIVELVNPQTGRVMEMPGETFDEMQAKTNVRIPARERYQMRYYQAFMGRSEFLEGPSPGPNPKGFTFNCVTGYRDRNERMFYGIMRVLMDPQRWFNRSLTMGLHHIQAAVKGGLIYEEGAVNNPDEFEAEYAQVASSIAVKDGAISNKRMMAKPSSSFPDLSMLLGVSGQAFYQTTGLNPEIMGQAEAQQAGVLDMQRKSAAMTILQELFDSLGYYLKTQGENQIYFMKTWLNDGRLIRIAGPQGQKWVPLALSPEAAFDVVVDEAPTSPDAKRRTWGVLTSLIDRLGSETPRDVIVESLEYSEMPQGLIEKIRQSMASAEDPEAAEAARQLQTQAQQLLIAKGQLELAEMQAKIRKLQAEAASTEAKIESEVFENEAGALLDLSKAKGEALSLTAPPLINGVRHG